MEGYARGDSNHVRAFAKTTDPRRNGQSSSSSRWEESALTSYQTVSLRSVDVDGSEPEYRSGAVDREVRGLESLVIILSLSEFSRAVAVDTLAFSHEGMTAWNITTACAPPSLCLSRPGCVCCHFALINIFPSPPSLSTTTYSPACSDHYTFDNDHLVLAFSHSDSSVVLHRLDFSRSTKPEGNAASIPHIADQQEITVS